MGMLASLIYGVFAVSIWAIGTVIYRICFHPLSKFPGPKLAATTRFYEFYLDCIRPGIHYQKIQEWHNQYGPIVRIGPNEVHVDDPDWFDVLYNPNMKLDKDPRYYYLLGNHDSAFVAVEHDVHRIKRAKQNPFFSRQNVDRSAPLINKILQTLFERFEVNRKNGTPIRLRYATRSFATDVVCDYCFPHGTNFVNSPDFSATYHRGQEGFNNLVLWMRHFPIIATLLNATPDWAIRYMDKEAQACISFLKFVELQVNESIRQSEAHEKETKRTIIRELYESDLPAEYRTQWCLLQEATGFVAGGAATIGRALEGGIFYILDNPAILKRLTEEVRRHKPEHAGLLTYRDLESLPYLNAVALECQRMFTAIPSRLPRINRTQDMFYNDWCIPKGTTVGMAAWDVLASDKVWGNASEFQPERWLDPAYRTKMQKYMVTFGRGSRNCIGQNLAIAELYTVLGNFFRSFDAELFETDVREIECVQDCFVPVAYKGSKGVQIVLK